MNLKNNILMVMGFLVLGGLFPVAAMAAPHFTLSPAAANETVGQNFVVTLGVDSGTEKVIGIDIKGTFDASKLEIVSIDKGTIPDDGYLFTYTPGQAIIRNDTGQFEATLAKLDSNLYTGVVAKHELLKITFRPKAAGTATLNYVCAAGSISDVNIINQSANDVVDCASNQSGSYTIAERDWRDISASGDIYARSNDYTRADINFRVVFFNFDGDSDNGSFT